MARKLIVEIIGDASSLNRSLGEAETRTTGFGNAVGKMSGVAKVAGAALIGGIAIGLDKSIHAALDAQAAQARLAQTFTNSGLSMKAYAGQLDATEAAGRKLGFSTTDTEQAIGSLVTATGNVKKATTDLSVAQDLARFKGIGLTDATKMMTMAMTGSQRASKQLGITVPSVTSTYDALKATMGKTIDAHEKLELATAKLTDKQLTGQAVIDAVSAKVRGQADAFSQTAAGGMEQFHAQLTNLEDKIGTALLPALTKVTDALSSFLNWLSNSPGVAQAAHDAFQVVSDVLGVLFSAGQKVVGWLQQNKTAAEALGVALGAIVIALGGPIYWVGALGVALIELYKHSQTFRDIVNGAFDAIKQKVDEVMPTIKKIISDTVTVVEAIWSRFGGTIISVLQTAVDTVKGVIHGISEVISGEFALIGDLIHGRWSKIWGDLVTILKGEWDIVTSYLGGLASIVFQLASAIGKAILDGIMAGIGDLGSAIANKVTGAAHGAIGAIKGALGIGSPSKLFADEIGSPMAEGVIQGWILSSASLPSKMSQTMQDAINAARTVVSNAQSTFTTAFGGLTSIADSAFDAVTGSIQTKSEKALAALTAAHDKQQAAQQKADATTALATAKTGVGAAQAALATAQVGGDPAAIQTAQDNLKSAQDQQVQAQRAYNDVIYQQKVTALTAQAAVERKNLDAQNAVRKQHFDDALNALQTHLAKHGATAATATQDVLKLLSSYGINFKSVGQDMGVAWIQGLKEALTKAAKGAGSLSKTISSASDSITVPKRQFGGPVTGGRPYLVGEAGPELFTPGAGGVVSPLGGGGAIYVTVNGWVGSDQQIAERLRRELLRTGIRNGTIFGQYA